MGRSRAVLCGECCERNYRLGEIVRCCGDDTVVIDGCDVGARGGLGRRWRGLGWQLAREKQRGGQGTEGSAGCGHSKRMLSAEG